MRSIVFIILIIYFCESFGYLQVSPYPLHDVRNKVVVITGAAQGIGYAIADNFLKNGAKVIIILDIDVPKGKNAEVTFNAKYGPNRAKFIECDVTKDLERVSELILKNYYVDVFVNNAGYGDENNPRKLLETNTIAVIEWSLKFREQMRIDKGGKGGTIINISSMYGYTIDPFLVSYKASKFGVLGFSEALGHELNYRLTGVRVLTVCPSATNTKFAATLFPEHEEIFKKFVEKMPVQSPDNVGKGTVQLYISAQTGTAWSIAAGRPPVLAPIGDYNSIEEIMMNQ